MGILHQKVILSSFLFLQEVNSSNRDAIRVLTKDNVLDDLVDKIIHTGDSAIEESDLGEQKLVACEIICSEVHQAHGLTDASLENCLTASSHLTHVRNFLSCY